DRAGRLRSIPGMSQHAPASVARPARPTSPALALTPVTPGVLQRCGTVPCSDCGTRDEERAVLRQRAFGTEPDSVPPIVHEVLRSGGRPLDAAPRAFLEQRFGHDFSHVRVHTDAKAADSARAVNAFAYTVGHDVVFGPGLYAPSTSAGR